MYRLVATVYEDETEQEKYFGDKIYLTKEAAEEKIPYLLTKIKEAFLGDDPFADIFVDEENSIIRRQGRLNGTIDECEICADVQIHSLEVVLSEKTEQIRRDLEKRFRGLGALYPLGVFHELFSKGINTYKDLTPVDLADTRAHIKELNAKIEAEKKIPIMSEDFQMDIIEACVALSQLEFNVFYDLISYYY